MNPNESLCIYDPRNPCFDSSVDLEGTAQDTRDNCSCDNCFYGRDKLAQEIIRLRAFLSRIAVSDISTARQTALDSLN